MDSFLRDLGFALRSLRRSAGFLAVTVLTLGLGIGATTAIYSVVHALLLRPLPYPDDGRIVQLWQVDARGSRSRFSDPNFDDLRTASRSFSALAELADLGPVSVTGGSEPVRAHAAAVSEGFFAALGVRPLRGRLFVPEEQREGGAPAVVVSHAFWRRALGGDPRAVSGATLTFDGHTHAVVGVMPDHLDYPPGVDLWTPRELAPRLPSRTAHNWQAVGRLRPGISLARAQAEVSAIAMRLKQRHGEDTWMSDAALVPLREQLVGHVRPALAVLLAASAFLLLIACANVVNLLLARRAGRQGELAARLALGAGPRRLAQQFLAEALLFCTAGGALGVALAALCLRLLLALEPGNLPRAGEIRLSVPVLLFALAVSLATAAALGLLTAWRATGSDLRAALAQAQRSGTGAGASQRVRSGLVIAQVALTVVLLVGAGLLGRSFLRLLHVDPGYRTERALVLDLSPAPVPDDEGRQRTVALYDDAITRLRALPGVAEVGGINAFPLTADAGGNGLFLVMSRPDEPLRFEDMPRLMRDPARTGQAEFRVASGGYFRAMGIPLVRGRLLDDDDDGPGAPHVAVISASLARAKWPGEDPLGKIIQFGNMDGDLHPFTVVGIVGDVREASLAADPRPTFYVSYRQRPRHARTFNLVLRTAGDPAAVAASARRLLRELAPDVPVRLRTVETVVAGSVADRRFLLLLVAAFGSAALLLAAFGVYGVIAFLVTQRRQEIAVRVALGAQRADVSRLVLRQGAALALAGVAAGAVAALALTRLLAGLLYRVAATDPLSFAAVSLGLIAVALLATYVPARRAARIEPMHLLRGS